MNKFLQIFLFQFMFFGYSQSESIKLNDQVDQLFKVWDTNNGPGLALAIIKDGAIVYKKS